MLILSRSEREVSFMSSKMMILQTAKLQLHSGTRTLKKMLMSHTPSKSTQPKLLKKPFNKTSNFSLTSFSAKLVLFI